MKKETYDALQQKQWYHYAVINYLLNKYARKCSEGGEIDYKGFYEEMEVYEKMIID